MTYHLSSEQYRRGVDTLAAARLTAAQTPGTLPRNSALIVGMAHMLAHLANSTPGKVMRDSDARLADLDSPLATVRGTCRAGRQIDMNAAPTFFHIDDDTECEHRRDLPDARAL